MSISSEISAWNRQVRDSFGKAVLSYEQNAPRQHEAASALANWAVEKMDANVNSNNMSKIERALEIGCGTGFLTRLMLRNFSNSEWVVSDVSSEMVGYCQSHPETLACDLRNVQFVVANGQDPGPALNQQRFDLICSSLTFQWFDDLERSLPGLVELLNPGGWLFFTTLDEDNLANIVGEYPCLAATIHSGSDSKTVSKILSPFGTVDCVRLDMKSEFRDLGQFLSSLKAIGAGTPRSDDRLDASELRSAIRRSRNFKENLVARYQFLMVAFQKDAETAE